MSATAHQRLHRSKRGAGVSLALSIGNAGGKPTPRLGRCGFPWSRCGGTIFGTLVTVISAACCLAAEPAEPPHTNRLAKEKSPYLLQHAHNPVDWYPWGDEAFAKAKREGKPIFLSIGYSTCHWCHVMERESFENEAVAKLINDSFVAIKVDREERPDVDRVYMAFVTATTGSGGWPMTVVLTPEGKPFFGGTYFPPEDARGMPGLKQIIGRVNEVWSTQQEKVKASAEELSKGLGERVRVKPDGAVALESSLADTAARKMATRFDPVNGGFGISPKFPQPPMLSFLLRQSQHTGDVKPRDMVLQTLRSIAAGGIHDHLGGGFHRYATDPAWFLPHFEKMLYDQAQLASVYLDAYILTGDSQYADAARDTLEYVLRDLTGEGGRFLSAEDADSATNALKPNDKSEGACYVWRGDEIAAALPGRAGELFAFRFGVEPAGNVKHDPHGEFERKNVLFAAKSLAETAKHFKLSEAQASKLLNDGRAKLLDARNLRPRPHRDEKTIVAWNGLMISALAKAGPVLREPKYIQAAATGAAFIRDHLYDAKASKLHRVYLAGSSDVEGFLDDHAFYIQALLDLYESSLDVRWLKLAVELQAVQDERFEDNEAGGYFTSPAGGDARLLFRAKDDDEGVEPSGAGVSALNLLRMSQMLDDEPMRKRAERTMQAFTSRLKKESDSMPSLLAAIGFHLAKPQQIVIAGDPLAADTRALLEEAFRHYEPNRGILCADGGPGQAFLASHAAFIKEMKPLDGKAAAYVCENYACKRPTSDVDTLSHVLAGEGKMRGGGQ